MIFRKAIEYMFKKYWTIIKAEGQRVLTYRVSIFAFRIGNLFEIFFQIIIWYVIFQEVEIIGGYSYKEMTTYVVVGLFFSLLTANYGYTNVITRDIHRGNLSNMLIKPIGYLEYIIVVALGRINVTLISSVTVYIVIFLVFHKYLIFPNSVLVYLILFFMIVIGFFVRLFFSILTAFAAFWLTETGGLQHTTGVIIKFLSGSYFPMILLPLSLVKISMFFPFVYVYFIPMQLYLGKISIAEGFNGLIIEIVWLVLLYLITKLVLKFGLKKYEAVGI